MHTLRAALVTLTCVASVAAAAEPDRYFQLDLKVEIDQVPYQVTYNWHCHQALEGPNFGPGGLFVPRWKQAPDLAQVIVRMTSESAFTFAPPPFYCGTESSADASAAYGISSDGERYLPPINVFDSIARPEIVEVYKPSTTEGRHKVSVRSGEIRRLNAPAPDYVESQVDAATNRMLRDPLRPYQYVIAWVSAESAWGTSDAIRRYFEHAADLVLAPRGTSQYAGERGIFDLKWTPFKQADLTEQPFKTSLRRTETAWSFANPSVETAGFFVRLPLAAAQPYQRPPVTVDYFGRPIRVESQQEIFDPSRKLFIRFVSGTVPFPTSY